MHATFHILNTFQWKNVAYSIYTSGFYCFSFVILLLPYLILIMYYHANYHANYVYLQMFMCTSGESATDMLGVCCSLLTSVCILMHTLQCSVNKTFQKSKALNGCV